jgi:hypothetical protein
VGTPSDDPFQRQWNLKPRIEALQTESKSTRRELADRYKTDETRLGIERDRVARDQYAADQAAKSADLQVKRDTNDAATEAKKAAEFEALAAKEERSGDRAAAEESREIAEVARVKQETHLARSRQATLDAAELRERAATHSRRVTELEVEREGLRSQAMKSEAELDNPPEVRRGGPRRCQRSAARQHRPAGGRAARGPGRRNRRQPGHDPAVDRRSSPPSRRGSTCHLHRCPKARKSTHRPRSRSLPSRRRRANRTSRTVTPRPPAPTTTTRWASMPTSPRPPGK